MVLVNTTIVVISLTYVFSVYEPKNVRMLKNLPDSESTQNSESDCMPHGIIYLKFSILQQQQRAQCIWTM